MKRIAIVTLLSAALSTACSPQRSVDKSDFDQVAYTPQYAVGFDLLMSPDSDLLLVTRSPWQSSDSTNSTSLLIMRPGSESEAAGAQMINGGAKRIVCMSSSYIAMLDALNATDRVVGVSGIDFISSPSIQARRDSIVDVGYGGNVDYEKLVATNPDLVLLYGVNSASEMESKLKQFGIPFAYIGDYMEESPLGKAEWIIPMGAITGLLPDAVAAFEHIPLAYDSLKRIASACPARPSVMLNTPYADSWFMASPHSYMATLISDAGADYAYTDSTSTSSTPVDIEQAYIMASNADFWINVGQLATLDQLKAQLPHFANVPSVTGKNVWNCNLKTTAGGGNDFWESGIVYPHLILSDLIKIFHPEALPDSVGFHYYRQLQ